MYREEAQRLYVWLLRIASMARYDEVVVQSFCFMGKYEVYIVDRVLPGITMYKRAFVGCWISRVLVLNICGCRGKV